MGLALLNYCQSDVDALAKLLPAMVHRNEIDLPRALLRGRYMAATARMEWAGVPIDADTLCRLRAEWAGIKSRLTAAVDRRYGVYVPTGAKRIEAGTVLGDALLQTADEWGIDAYALAEAVDYLHEQERQTDRDHLQAVAAARKTILEPKP